jgi:SAM-dependent methyltransferase
MHFNSTLESKYSKIEFTFFECKLCGFAKVINPRSDFEKLYDQNYYSGVGADTSVNYLKETKPKSLAAKIRNLEYQGLSKMIETTLEKKKNLKILDFGGGVGGLTRYLIESGWNSTLFDFGFPFDLARESGLPTTNLKETTELYDYIFAIEVIEHAADPNELFKQLLRNLKPGGIIIITTGNRDKAPPKLSNWRYAKIPDVHVSFWTPKSFEIQANKFGCQIREHNMSMEIIQYKVIKNLGRFGIAAYYCRYLWKFSTPMIDRAFGVSSFGAIHK